MPTVILRGSKSGHKVSRLVLEGSSGSPIRWGDLNGEPFEVTDEEFDRLGRNYLLEPADGKPDNTEQPPPEEDDGGTDNEDDET